MTMRPQLVHKEETIFNIGQLTQGEAYAASTKIGADAKPYAHFTEISEGVPIDSYQNDTIQYQYQGFTKSFDESLDNMTLSSYTTSTELSSPSTVFSKWSSPNVSPTSSEGRTDWDQPIPYSDLDIYEQVSSLDNREPIEPTQPTPGLPLFEPSGAEDFKFCCPDQVASPYTWQTKFSDPPTTTDSTLEDETISSTSRTLTPLYTGFSASDLGIPTSESGQHNHSMNCDGNIKEYKDSPGSYYSPSSPFVKEASRDLNSPQLDTGEPSPMSNASPTPTSATSSVSSGPLILHAMTKDEETTHSFRCPHCEFVPRGKLQNLKAYLRKHVKTHTKREVKCSHCSKVFTRQDNLTTHTTKVHRSGNILARNLKANLQRRGSEASYENEPLYRKRNHVRRNHQKLEDLKELEMYPN